MTVVFCLLFLVWIFELFWGEIFFGFLGGREMRREAWIERCVTLFSGFGVQNNFFVVRVRREVSMNQL